MTIEQQLEELDLRITQLSRALDAQIKRADKEILHLSKQIDVLKQND